MSSVNWTTGRFRKGEVNRTVKRLRDLEGIFEDASAWRVMDGATVVCSVEWEERVQEGTEGGLFWGSTVIEPGQVGGEYFMTRGHFHAKRNRGEYYTTVQGSGLLGLMNAARCSRVEEMVPGSLHYIPGFTAHRAVNVGNTPLIFWACWHSDAGHDYETIAERGFSQRVLARNGLPVLV